MSITILRILLLPVAIVGIVLIWIYVAMTLGPSKANEVVWDVLDL